MSRIIAQDFEAPVQHTTPSLSDNEIVNRLTNMMNKLKEKNAIDLANDISAYLQKKK